MDDAELRAAVSALLADHTVLSLATAHKGHPHAANVMYAPDGFTLYWFSTTATRHSQGLAADPAVALTIADQYADFGEIRGLQLHGAARPAATDADRDHGLACLALRFPFLEQFRSGAGALVRRLQQATVYRFDPVEITLIDNRRGFGFKRTLRP